MKILKKILSLLLGAAVALPLGVVGASAAEEFTITVGVPTKEFSRGEEFEVPITLANNPGITSVAFTVELDSERLEWVGEADYYNRDSSTFPFVDGKLEGFDGLTAPGKLTDKFNFYSGNGGNVTIDGTILTLKLKVKADAPAGDAVVKLNIAAEDVFDEEFAEVLYTLKDGTAKVVVPSSDDKFTITVGVPTKEFSRGDEFEVPITLANNPGITSVAFTVELDSERLEWVGEADYNNRNSSTFPFVDGKLEGFDGLTAPGELTDKFNFYSGNGGNVTTDGTILTLKLKVKADAPAGDAAVKLNIAAEDVFDEEFAEVSYTLKDGTAKVVVATDKTDVSDKITFVGGEFTYNGSPQTLAAPTIADEDDGTWTFSGDGLTQTNAGSYSTTAIFDCPTAHGEKTVSWTINPKALTVTGATATDRAYDGTTAVAITSGTLVGVVTDDDVSIGSISGTIADADADVDKAVTVTLTLAGADEDNYTVTAPTGLTVNISQKTLTVSGAAATDRAYDGTKAVAITGGALVGVVADDDVSISSISGEIANADADIDKAVTVTITLAGADEDNYTVTAPNGLTVNISQKTLTVSGAAATDRAYDGTTAVSITGGALVGVVTDDDVSIVSISGTIVSANAGVDKAVTVTITLAGSDQDNYTVTAPTDLTVTITQAAPTYAVPESKSVKVGSALDVYTAVAPSSATGVGGVTVIGSVDWFSDSGYTAAAQDSDVADLTSGDTITLYWRFTPASSNYGTVVGSTLFTVTAGDLQPMAFADTAVTKTYGDAKFTNAASHTASDFDEANGGISTRGAITYSSDDEAVATVDSATGEVTILAVGNVTITATAAAVAGKWAEDSVSYVLTVTRKTPTIDDLTYDLTSNVYNGNPQGIPAPTAAQGVTGLGAITVKYDDGDTVPTNAGTYEVSAVIAQGDNYTAVTLTLGDYSITPKAIEITDATVEAKTYDGTTDATVSDVTFSDKPADYKATAVFASADAGTDKAATVTVALVDTNYTLSASTFDTTADISKATTTGVAQTLSVVEDNAAEYEFDLTKLLPNLASPLTLGTVGYAVSTVDNADGVLGTWTDGSVTTPLTLGVASAEVGKTATVTVTVTSTNYADFTADITVEVVAGTPVEPGDTTAPTVTNIGAVNDNSLFHIDTDITIVFSEAMQKTGTVSGVGEYTPAWNTDGTELTINPMTDLAYSTDYTLTFAGFADLAGNELVAGTSYNFTTVAAPVVPDPDPTDGVATLAQYTDFMFDLTGVDSTLIYGASVKISPADSNGAIFANSSVADSYTSTSFAPEAGWGADVLFDADGVATMLREAPLFVGGETWLNMGVQSWKAEDVTLVQYKILGANGVVLKSVPAEPEPPVEPDPDPTDVIAVLGNFELDLANLKPEDIYGVYLKVDPAAGAYGGICLNSNSTGWAQTEWGSAYAGKPVVYDDNGEMTHLSDTAFFLATDADFFQIHIQNWGPETTLLQYKILGKDGVVLKSVPAEPEPPVDPEEPIATLSALWVSNYTLTPQFSANVYSYTINVVNSVDYITIGATATDPDSTISGLGGMNLNVGANVFYVTVTAQDGVTQITYRITVTRSQPPIYYPTDPTPPTPPVTPTDPTPPTTPTDPATPESPETPETKPEPKPEVTAEEVEQLILEGESTVKMTGSLELTIEELQTLANAMAESDTSVKIYADSYKDDGKLDVRAYVYPEDFEGTEMESVSFKATTSGESVEKTQKLFDRVYGVEPLVISFEQIEFKTKVHFAAKMDLGDLDIDNLIFYSYNPETNKFKRVNIEYRVDKNGYLHVYVDKAANLLIVDQPLKK
jgi:HSP20 family molecular chaperone IbpA